MISNDIIFLANTMQYEQHEYVKFQSLAILPPTLCTESTNGSSIFAHIRRKKVFLCDSGDPSQRHQVTTHLCYNVHTAMSHKN